MSDNGTTGAMEALQRQCVEVAGAMQRVLETVRLEMTGAPVLMMLGERIGSLLDEFAWELGIVNMVSVAADIPTGFAPGGATLDHVGVAVQDLATAAAHENRARKLPPETR